MVGQRSSHDKTNSRAVETIDEEDDPKEGIEGCANLRGGDGE